MAKPEIFLVDTECVINEVSCTVLHDRHGEIFFAMTNDETKHCDVLPEFEHFGEKMRKFCQNIGYFTAHCKHQFSQFERGNLEINERDVEFLLKTLKKKDYHGERDFELMDKFEAFLRLPANTVMSKQHISNDTSTNG